MTVTRSQLAAEICAIIQKDVDAKLRETDGKNRSPRIDEFNHRAHEAMGAPYCAAGGTCAIDDACKKLGLKNPIGVSGSSQYFDTKIPAKFHSKTVGYKGSVAKLTDHSNHDHGHYTTLREDVQPGHSTFFTLEYNTGPDGGRDGDGAYAKTRSTIDSGHRDLYFNTFIDTVGFILEANGIHA